MAMDRRIVHKIIAMAAKVLKDGNPDAMSTAPGIVYFMIEAPHEEEVTCSYLQVCFVTNSVIPSLLEMIVAEVNDENGEPIDSNWRSNESAGQSLRFDTVPR